MAGLLPRAEAADNLTGLGQQPYFGISGAAYLKPWLDWYRAEAPGGSIFVTAGNSVGATQPISNFFGDKPTIEALNMMGLSADTLGNHNFDRGSEYLRTELIPLATYPYLAANAVYPDGTLPAGVDGLQMSLSSTALSWVWLVTPCPSCLP